MRKKLTNNIYNLDPKLDRKHKSVVLSLELQYFVPEDTVEATVDIRQDAHASPELVTRLARAVESTFRRISPDYAEDLDLLEQVAKTYLTEECEPDGSGQSQNNNGNGDGCRCR